MASISKESNGHRTIQFIAGDGKRKSIRLGKASQKTAQTIKGHVEALNVAAISGTTVERETAVWLAGIDETLRKKLASVGLVAFTARVSLGAFVRRYIEGRHDLKVSTVSHLERVEQDLNSCFTANINLGDFTAADGDRFRLYLLGKGLAENTVRRRCGRAKQFFTAAKRSGLITENPFSKIKSSVQANTARFHFVTAADARKVLDACPDAERRVLFALSRFGGLRCPSEH